MSKNTHYFTLSITTAGGLTEAHVETVRKYLDDKCQYAYVSNEFGENETNSHVQAVVSFTTSKQSNVMDKMKRLYKKLELDIVNRHTVVIHPVVAMDGALHYIEKEYKGKGKCILRKGWQQGWIDDQVKEYAKRVAGKGIKKMGVRLTQTTAPEAMYVWAKANNMHVEDKRSFIQVGKLMAAEGYKFGTCRTKGLYMDVCALFGDGRALEDVWESDLQFIN